MDNALTDDAFDVPPPHPEQSQARLIAELVEALEELVDQHGTARVAEQYRTPSDIKALAVLRRARNEA